MTVRLGTGAIVLNCVVCGKSLEVKPTGRPRRTCSDRCRQIDSRERRKSRAAARPFRDSRPGPTSNRHETVPVAAAHLRHIAGAARNWPTTGAAAMLALQGAEQAGDGAIELNREAAEELLAGDCLIHGYGTNRALRSDRDDCEPCAAIGRALEELLPGKLSRRRAIAAGRATPVGRKGYGQ